MKSIYKTAILALLIMGCKEAKKEVDKAEEIIEETAVGTTADEWTVIFDGVSFDGWHEYLKEGISDNWKIEEGAMVLYPPGEHGNGEQFNLVTDHEYEDFVLSLDWQISEAGNSGVMWGVKEIADLGQPYLTGPEVQVLDNEKHPDGKNGTSHQSGALYDMVSPAKDVTNPVGEWNTMVITINHKTNEGSVMLNGEEVVDFPVNDPEWQEMVAKSKFAEWEHFAKYKKGKIALQDHGNMVAFKNIKIKEL
ncbi:3-keto-disaccharide hydrolase [Maribacter sp. CXY002]|uniref:3-keto-disaccharide hydrolase n=1 Tax=Maribacter luteocoastalis TaxID=3407671 RepID=UPI003B6710CA